MSFFAALHGYGDLGLLALRVGLGSSFLWHGLSKRKMWKMQPSEQLPKKMLSIMRLLSVCEPIGAVGMFVGGLTQLDAACLAVIMLGAANLKRNKMKKTFGEHGGWELDMMNLAMCVALVFLGAGRWSADRMLFGL